MEALSVLSNVLPYDHRTFWETEGTSHEQACDDEGKLLNRAVRWNLVCEALNYFTVDDVEVTDDKDFNITDQNDWTDLLTVYNSMKNIQHKHRSSSTTEGICLSLSDEFSSIGFVTVFLVAVHLLADHNSGSEPIDRPLLRFKIGTKGRAMLNDVGWMIDPMNPIESVVFADLARLFDMYTQMNIG